MSHLPSTMPIQDITCSFFSLDEHSDADHHHHRHRQCAGVQCILKPLHAHGVYLSSLCCDFSSLYSFVGARRASERPYNVRRPCVSIHTSAGNGLSLPPPPLLLSSPCMFLQRFFRTALERNTWKMWNGSFIFIIYLWMRKHQYTYSSA